MISSLNHCEAKQVSIVQSDHSPYLGIFIVEYASPSTFYPCCIRRIMLYVPVPQWGYLCHSSWIVANVAFELRHGTKVRLLR